MKKKKNIERDVTPKPKALSVGRPSKYKPEFCQMLIAHMSQGYSYETFAADIDVDRDTLYHWEKIFPEFSDTKRKAVLKCQRFWEKQGIDGMVMPKGFTFSSSMWIFNMKARFKWRDGNEETKDKNPDQTKKVYKVKWADEDDGTDNIGDAPKDSATKENK